MSNNLLASFDSDVNSFVLTEALTNGHRQFYSGTDTYLLDSGGPAPGFKYWEMGPVG